MAWFTYVDASVPEPAAGLDTVGALDNRWLTASLEVDGTVASGPVHASTGGRFDSPAQPAQQSVEVGSMSVEFSDCDRGIVRYAIDDGMIEGEFPIIPLEKRVSDSFRCKSRAEL